MNFKDADKNISKYMERIAIPAIRISCAVIFFWFGILKPFGLSSAEPLLKATISWLPIGAPDIWLEIIGWWEVLIGITFLFKKTTKIAIGLLFLQMIGTFMPLVFLPEIAFQKGNYILPTLEGQYIIKNIMIISAALVVGGKFYRDKK